MSLVSFIVSKRDPCPEAHSPGSIAISAWKLVLGDNALLAELGAEPRWTLAHLIRDPDGTALHENTSSRIAAPLAPAPGPTLLCVAS